MASLPGLDCEVFFGDAEQPLPNWREVLPKEDSDDDKLSDEERTAVWEMIGFEPPAEATDEDEAPTPPEPIQPSPFKKSLTGYRTKAKGTCKQGQNPKRDHCTAATKETGQTAPSPTETPPQAESTSQTEPTKEAKLAGEQLTNWLANGVGLGAETYNNDPTAKFHTPIEYVQAKGQTFFGRALPEGIAQGKIHECFKNASLLVVADSKLRYVEGFAMREGLLPVLHAWAIDQNNNVIDCTWPELERTAYRGVVYDRDEFLKHLYKKKFYGLLGGRDKDARQILHDGGLATPKTKKKNV